MLAGPLRGVCRPVKAFLKLHASTFECALYCDACCEAFNCEPAPLTGFVCRGWNPYYLYTSQFPRRIHFTVTACLHSCLPLCLHPCSAEVAKLPGLTQEAVAELASGPDADTQEDNDQAAPQDGLSSGMLQAWSTMKRISCALVCYFSSIHELTSRIYPCSRL